MMAISSTKAKPKSATAANTSSEEAPKKRGSIAAPTIPKAEVVAPKVSVIETAVPLAPVVAASAKQQGGTGQNNMLKKQVLVERIVKASGAKKKDVKLIVEATLGVLGDALSAGEELNLPPLGKLKVNRQRDEGNVEVLILKLRRGGGQAGGGNAAPIESDDDGEDV
jgi:hypothetical protein